MSEWKEYNLDEAYSFSSGLSKSRDQFGFGFPFLSFKDVFHNYFLPKKLEQLANTTEKERQRCSIKRGDVFLTRTSEKQEELGLSSVALANYPGATFNGFTKRLRPKGNIDILPEYAGFYFRSPNFRAVVTSMASMTTRASLNNDMLKFLTIKVPPLKEQNAIASVLTSLDDKIDLLYRQNKTLEEMAEALFRQWFVERSLSGAEGEADDEWEERPLSSIATFHNGLACQKYPPKNEVDKLPVLKIKELRNGISEDCDWCTTEVDEKYIVKNGDVIFSWSASLMVKIWNGETCILNQHLFKVTSDDFPKWYYYLWSKFHLDQFIAIAKAHATTMGHIKRGDLDEAMVLIPSDYEITEMTIHFEPILEKIVENNTQIRTLTALRDTLLPKLMSGEVSLSNIGEVRIAE